MIRRSPCEAYIKFLILQSVKRTDAQVKELLLESQLDYVSGSYLKKLRAQCRPPEPFYPLDKSHRRSRDFLLGEGVADLFDRTRDVRGAMSILKTPRAKEFVEATTLTRAPPRTIAVFLSRQRGHLFDEEAVLAYQRYFWNIELVDSTEMRALLLQRASAAETHSDPEVQSQTKNYRSAAYNDPRRVAAQMPASPLGARLAQLRMGFTVHTDELTTIVEQLRLIALARALEVTTYGGPEDSMKALNYALTAEKMGNILEQVVRPDEEIRNQLGAIALRTNAPNKTPSLRQLSGGHHTTNVLPGVKSSDRKAE